MANKILIKKSTVPGNIPDAAQLDVGELAVNTADGLLYTKHSDGSIVTLSGSAAGDAPAGGGGTYLLRTLLGSTAAWESITDDISTYVSAGSNVRIAFQYKSGASYTGDVQIDSVQIPNDFIHNFDGSAESYEVATATSSDVPYDSVAAWSPIATSGSTTGIFNRDSGGTPSGNTGLTTASSGSWYIYAETSATGIGYPNMYFWVRTPAITLSTNATSLVYAVARYGATIGTLKTYLIVE